MNGREGKCKIMTIENRIKGHIETRKAYKAWRIKNGVDDGEEITMTVEGMMKSRVKYIDKFSNGNEKIKELCEKIL